MGKGTYTYSSCDGTVVSNFSDKADNCYADLSAPHVSKIIDATLIPNLVDDAVSQTKPFTGLRRHFLRRQRNSLMVRKVSSKSMRFLTFIQLQAFHMVTCGFNIHKN